MKGFRHLADSEDVSLHILNGLDLHVECLQYLLDIYVFVYLFSNVSVYLYCTCLEVFISLIESAGVNACFLNNISTPVYISDVVNVLYFLVNNSHVLVYLQDRYKYTSVFIT